jgi:hypothetical protein
MTLAATASAAPHTAADFSLSAQQVAFFRTFGFLKLPRLFAPDLARIVDGFEDAFASRAPDRIIREDPLQETDNAAFADRKRVILFQIVEQSEKLGWLASDPRVRNIVQSIVGERYEARPTDGHIFHCDTSWHPDKGSDARFRLKLSFYLDPQRADSGAIRVIPGSHFSESAYAQALLDNLYGSPRKVQENYGIDAHEVPSWTIETDPGDLVCWDFRTFHATFNGFERRRLFSMTYCEPA